MKIAFWSEDDGCGMTSSMAAIASVCSNAWQLKTVLMQSRGQEGDLGRKLEGVPLTGLVREECSYYALDGLDYLLWQEKNQRLNTAMVEESMVPVVKNKLFYLPQGERKKPCVYPEELKGSMHRIILEAEKLSDVTFVDCGCGEDALSAYLLQCADVAVINFSQERRCIDTYFQKHHAYTGRVIYLINRYQQESIYNKSNLQRIYRFRDEELAVIPDNPIFRHASDHGQVERFVRRHIQGRTMDHQFFFMQELVQAAQLILQAAGIAA